jgi:hypothetical protein
VGQSVGQPKPFECNSDVDCWRDRFRRRCQREHGLLYPGEQAEALGYNHLIRAWHKRHGRKWPAWQCAGCNMSIGGLPALNLADGNRVHLDEAHGLECLLAFGERWRAEAIAGLRAMGFDPPPDFEPLRPA